MIVTPQDQRFLRNTAYDRRINVLMQDKAFSWYFVYRWAQKNGYRLVPNDERRREKSIPSEPTFEHTHEPDQEDNAVHEPEYVPLIE